MRSRRHIKDEDISLEALDSLKGYRPVTDVTVRSFYKENGLN